MMKFFHLSDIHIGKRVNGFSMLDDQRYVLQQILDLAEKEKPDGVLIAGDLYDKSMPSAEAVEVADWFLTELAGKKLPVWLIAGNHDSAERVAYAAAMLEKAGVYVSRVFDGKLQSYSVIRTENGLQVKRGNEAQCASGSEQVTIYLMPYLRPTDVRRYYPNLKLETTEQAVQAVIDSTVLSENTCNILLMHQFMSGASVCESEEMTVGGLDQINASVVEAFDYVALGHLHGPQRVGSEKIRYCGSPLKYSFSEVNQKKSVTVLTIEDHHTVSVDTIPLTARRDLREIRGPIEELLNPEVYGGTDTEDYLHITLTDEGGVLDAIGRLREVYPNIMRLDFAASHAEAAENEMNVQLEEKTPLELFEEFFELQTGRTMNEEQIQLITDILK